MRVKFSVSYVDIVRPDPVEIVIPASEPEFSKDIKVFGLSAGHAVITANISPAISKYVTKLPVISLWNSKNIIPRASY